MPALSKLFDLPHTPEIMVLLRQANDNLKLIQKKTAQNLKEQNRLASIEHAMEELKKSRFLPYGTEEERILYLYDRLAPLHSLFLDLTSLGSSNRSLNLALRAASLTRRYAIKINDIKRRRARRVIQTINSYVQTSKETRYAAMDRRTKTPAIRENQATQAMAQIYWPQNRGRQEESLEEQSQTWPPHRSCYGTAPIAARTGRDIETSLKPNLRHSGARLRACALWRV